MNRANPLFEKLRSLDLPLKDLAVFGSGPLFVHGLRDQIHDLDIVARGDAWAKSLDLGRPVATDSGVGARIVLCRGEIEVYSGWAPGEWSVDRLIDSADVVDGIRFVQLADVLRWKRLMGRAKDLTDVARIETFLGSH